MHYVNSNHKSHGSCQVYEDHSRHHSTSPPVQQSYKTSIQRFGEYSCNMSEPGEQKIQAFV